MLNTTQNHPFWNETDKKCSDAKEMRDLTVDDIHTY